MHKKTYRLAHGTSIFFTNHGSDQTGFPNPSLPSWSLPSWWVLVLKLLSAQLGWPTTLIPMVSLRRHPVSDPNFVEVGTVYLLLCLLMEGVLY